MKRRYFYFNDKFALEKFKLHVDANEDEDSEEVAINYADRARKKQKLNRVASSANIDLKWVKPTSNCCERSFSGARLILTDYRKSMTPYNFECVMQLKYNH